MSDFKNDKKQQGYDATLKLIQQITEVAKNASSAFFHQAKFEEKRQAYTRQYAAIMKIFFKNKSEDELEKIGLSIFEQALKPYEKKIHYSNIRHQIGSWNNEIAEQIQKNALSEVTQSGRSQQAIEQLSQAHLKQQEKETMPVNTHPTSETAMTAPIDLPQSDDKLQILLEPSKTTPIMQTKTEKANTSTEIAPPTSPVTTESNDLASPSALEAKPLESKQPQHSETPMDAAPPILNSPLAAPTQQFPLSRTRPSTAHKHSKQVQSLNPLPPPPPIAHHHVVEIITPAQAQAILESAKKLVDELKDQAFQMTHTILPLNQEEHQKLLSIRALYQTLEKELLQQQATAAQRSQDEGIQRQITQGMQSFGKMLSRHIFGESRPPLPPPNTPENIFDNITRACAIKQHIAKWKTERIRVMVVFDTSTEQSMKKANQLKNCVVLHRPNAQSTSHIRCYNMGQSVTKQYQLDYLNTQGLISILQPRKETFKNHPNIGYQGYLTSDEFTQYITNTALIQSPGNNPHPSRGSFFNKESTKTAFQTLEAKTRAKASDAIPPLVKTK